MEPDPNAIVLACVHEPHTNLVRVARQPPDVVLFYSCEECARDFLQTCLDLGGESVKPENLM